MRLVHRRGSQRKHHGCMLVLRAAAQAQRKAWAGLGQLWQAWCAWMQGNAGWKLSVTGTSPAKKHRGFRHGPSGDKNWGCIKMGRLPAPAGLVPMPAALLCTNVLVWGVLHCEIVLQQLPMTAGSVSSLLGYGRGQTLWPARHCCPLACGLYCLPA